MPIRIYIFVEIVGGGQRQQQQQQQQPIVTDSANQSKSRLERVSRTSPVHHRARSHNASAVTVVCGPGGDESAAAAAAAAVARYRPLLFIYSVSRLFA